MNSDRMLLKKDIKEKRELVNIQIDRFLPRKDEYPKQVHKALRHTLFAGGKRLRPYLMINSFLLFSDEVKKTYLIAGALEMLHTYTLIHDDLPEIDNDDYRRGKKSCHVLFGSDIALMAGDALLVYAFDAINSAEIDNKLKLTLIRELSEIAGSEGLIAGQMVDILSEGKKVSRETLNFIHHNKTGKLIQCAVRFGCYMANASDENMKLMETIGEKLGLAFQITDDILDIEGETQDMGKTIGKDKVSQKATFPSIYGLSKSKIMAEKLIEDSKELLDRNFGERAKIFILLADFILTRKI